VFLLFFSSVKVGFLRLFIRLFRLVLLRASLIGAVQLYSIPSIFSMLLVSLLWSIGLIPIFKEAIINLDS